MFSTAPEVAASPFPCPQFPEGELGNWACLGHITDRSARVWLRARSTDQEVASLEIDGKVVAQGYLRPAEDRDFVGAVDIPLDHPRPGSHFNVHVARHRRAGVLAPQPHQPAPFSFAIGSCNQPFKINVGGKVARHQDSCIYADMRRQMSAEDVKFTLLLGDQIYSDGITNLNIRKLAASGLLEQKDLTGYYRHLYRGYFNESGFRSVLESAPSYMVWDDHDILDNWGSFPHPNEFERSAFQAATTAYVEYQHLHNPGASLGDSSPFSYSFWYADIGFLVLDLRSQRSFDDGRVIGEAQWRELDAFLAAATDWDARTLFVAATIPPVHFSPAIVRLLDGIPGNKGENVRDRWDYETFKADRDRLLHTLCDWQAGGESRQAVILSGDVHAGAAFQVRRRHGQGEVLQWTSSAMSAPGGLAHTMANHLGSAMVNLGEKDFRVAREAVQAKNNFGVVRVEPPRPGETRGHRISFVLYKYHPARRRLTTAFSITHQPR